MFAVNYRELRQMYQSLGARQACEQITEWLEMGRRGEAGGLSPDEFSLRDLAEAMVENGREWVAAMNPAYQSSVLEAGDAVDSTAFSNITGQIMYTAFLRGYESPEFVFTAMTPVVQTRFKDGEKIPGVENLKDDLTDVIHEGMPYSYTKYGEDWIETPALEKLGRLLAITREMIFADTTGRAVHNATQLGDIMGLRKEKRLTDHYIGAINTYTRKGSTLNTYQTSTPWINSHDNQLTLTDGWDKIDKARLLFADMKDFNTGESIRISANTIVTTPHRSTVARHLLNSTEARTGDVTGGTQMIGSNPLTGLYRHVESQHFYDRIQSQLSVAVAKAKEYWLLLDPSRFIQIMQGWPTTLSQAPTNASAEFERDIVVQYKVSSFDVPAIMEPRASVLNFDT